MRPESGSEHLVSETPAGVRRRVASALLWYALPALTVAAVLAYIGLAIAWRVNPPVVPVAGRSMRPALDPGDVVFLKGAAPGEIRRGDVIAFRVPEATRQKYGLPGTYVHRVVAIQRGAAGYQFRTRGDAVRGPDPFWVLESELVGRVVARAPGLGYPILFFRSRQGQLFAAAALLILLVYFLLGVVDRRREFASMNALALASLVGEARELRDAMLRATGMSRAPPPAPLQAGAQRLCSRGCHALPGWAKFDPHTGERLPPAVPEEPPAPTSAALVPYVPPPAPGIDFDRLEAELHRAVRSSEQVQSTMRELAGAVAEYGEHLRSHTEVMKNLAASTHELTAATGEMRTILAALAEAVARLGGSPARDAG